MVATPWGKESVVHEELNSSSSIEDEDREVESNERNAIDDESDEDRGVKSDERNAINDENGRMAAAKFDSSRIREDGKRKRARMEEDPAEVSNLLPVGSSRGRGRFSKALATWERVKQEREAARLQAVQVAAEKVERKEQRDRKFRQLTRRTGRGQPFMEHQVKHLLERIEKRAPGSTASVDLGKGGKSLVRIPRF